MKPAQKAYQVATMSPGTPGEIPTPLQISPEPIWQRHSFQLGRTQSAKKKAPTSNQNRSPRTPREATEEYVHFMWVGVFVNEKKSQHIAPNRGTLRVRGLSHPAPNNTHLRTKDLGLANLPGPQTTPQFFRESPLEEPIFTGSLQGIPHPIPPTSGKGSVTVPSVHACLRCSNEKLVHEPGELKKRKKKHV